MKVYGKQLEFISEIKRDGSGTVPVPPFAETIWEETPFELNPLSITKGTYIANGSCSFVVRKKQNQ